MSGAEGLPYTDEFYRDHREVSLRSAEAIVPVVLRLVQPQSVVDVGCGIGTWLSVFRTHGVIDVHGMDTRRTPKRSRMVAHRSSVRNAPPSEGCVG